MRGLFLELRKTKRRGVWLVVAGLILMQFLWSMWAFSDRLDAEDLAQGWISQIYMMPVLNAILTPTFIAVLASRLTDMEHKGNTWKMLETFQSRNSIYFAKLLYGFVCVLIFAASQLGFLIFFGKHFGYTDSLDLWAYARYFAVTVAVSFLIYLLHLILAFAFTNQAVTLCAGLLGSMCGLFLMYLPPSLIVNRLIPWGLYGASSFVWMDWDPDTRVIKYRYHFQHNGAEIITAIWIVLLLSVGWALFNKMETEGLNFSGIARFGIFGRKRRLSKIKIPRMPVEFIKIKRTPIWLAFIILPLISAVIGSMNYMNNLGVLKKAWYSLWSQHSLFFAFFFLPPLIGVYASYLWRLEHSGTNWNTVMTLVSPFRLVFGKLCICAVMTTATIMFMICLYVFSGFICGLSLPLPKELGEWTICGIFGGIAVCSVQLFLSLVIRSFAVPIAIGLVGGVVGMLITSKGLYYLLPYSLLSVGLRANNPQRIIDLWQFADWTVLYIVVINALSVLYLKRKDVRTQE